MDVGDATVFGQHALAYAVLAYSRRVLPPPRAALSAVAAGAAGGGAAAAVRALVLLVRFVGGAPLPRWTYFVPPLVGALLWPLVSVLLQWPQRPARAPADR